MGFHPLDFFTSGVIYSTVDTLSLVGYPPLPILPPTVPGSSIVIWKSRSGGGLLLWISADIVIKIIVLEDTKLYIGYAPREEIEEHDRRPFDLLVILNPQLRKKSNKSALFFEGCLRSF